MDEDVVVVLSSKGFRPPMREFGWLVPQQLSRFQVKFVIMTGIVFNMERPLATSLADVDDCTDDMGVKLKEGQQIFGT